MFAPSKRRRGQWIKIALQATQHAQRRSTFYKLAPGQNNSGPDLTLNHTEYKIRIQILKCAHDGAWFQTPLLNRVCFILWLNVPIQVVRAVQLPLQLLLRSQRACHHPLHTSIRPSAHLSVTPQSPTSLPKPFISGLMQVLARIWHTTHVGKHANYRAGCVVCVCQCLFIG